MNRYAISFFLTLFFYTALVVSYIYSINNTKVQKTVQPKSTQSIKFTVIAQPKPIIKTEPKIKPKPIIKPKAKPKLKPVIKIKPKKKPKPIVKPKAKTVQKQIIKPIQKVEPEPIIKKEPTPKIIPKKTIKQTQIKKNNSLIKKVIPTIDFKELERKQKLFYKKIKTTINKNKSYPRKAIKRGIQGDIKISFMLLSSGEVRHIRVISGKNIFKKSAINSIQKSFPMEIDDKLFKFPKSFTIKLKFKLN